MSWLSFFIGYSVCATILIVILVLQIGDKYEINGRIKQKGRNTTNTVSDIKTSVKTPKKEGILKRIKKKRQTKKNKND
jgi:hypothetical protein